MTVPPREMLADFNRAIELGPDDARAIGSRGETYQAIDRYEDALADRPIGYAAGTPDAYYGGRLAALVRVSTNELRITSVFPCVARGLKPRASFMLAGCWW